MDCLICRRGLEFHRRKGWIHRETASIYIMKCKDCGFEGGNSVNCPKCGSKNYVDDHCVRPKYGNS